MSYRTSPVPETRQPCRRRRRRRHIVPMTVAATPRSGDSTLPRHRSPRTTDHHASTCLMCHKHLLRLPRGQQKDSRHDEHGPQHNASGQPLNAFEKHKGQRQDEQRCRAIQGRDDAHLPQPKGDSARGEHRHSPPRRPPENTTGFCHRMPRC